MARVRMAFISYNVLLGGYEFLMQNCQYSVVCVLNLESVADYIAYRPSRGQDLYIWLLSRCIHRTRFGRDDPQSALSV